MQAIGIFTRNLRWPVGCILVAMLIAMESCTSSSTSNPCDAGVNECIPADGGVDAAGGTGVADANLDVVSIETRGDAPAEAAPECVTAAECKNPLRPICSGAGRCQPCGSDNSCTGLASGSKCALTGACVVCLSSATCDEATPICTSDNRCVACNTQGADATACKTRNAAIPICASTGAKAGQCVECATDAQCEATSKPICDQATQACRRCQKDLECAVKSAAAPGICMSHDDGRCATSAESVIVQGGDLQAAINSAVSGGKKLVVVTDNSDRATFLGPGALSIVGRGATRPSVGSLSKPGISITGGQIYLRNLLITSSAGGILIDGAAFEIDNCEVSRNNTGTIGTSKWGGILVNNPGAPKRLSNVVINDNVGVGAVGLVCSAPVTLVNVSAKGNTGGDIAPECQ
jgi:hypothetical protein